MDRKRNEISRMYFKPICNLLKQWRKFWWVGQFINDFCLLFSYIFRKICVPKLKQEVDTKSTKNKAHVSKYTLNFFWWPIIAKYLHETSVNFWIWSQTNIPMLACFSQRSKREPIKIGDWRWNYWQHSSRCCVYIWISISTLQCLDDRIEFEFH
jgi:hypothetical protein